MSIEKFHQQGVNHTMIAAKLGISRKTVSRYLQGGEKKPVYGPRPARPSKLKLIPSLSTGTNPNLPRALCCAIAGRDLPAGIPGLLHHPMRLFDHHLAQGDPDRGPLRDGTERTSPA